MLWRMLGMLCTVNIKQSFLNPADYSSFVAEHVHTFTCMTLGHNISNSTKQQSNI